MKISVKDYKALLSGKARPKPRRSASRSGRSIPDESHVGWTRVVLDVAPAPKERHRHALHSKRDLDGQVTNRVITYTPKSTRSFERTVRQMLQIALGPNHRPLEGRVAMTMAFLIQRDGDEHLVTDKPDLDNVEKSLKDACNRVIYADDSQVTWVQKAKIIVDGPGRIILGFGPDKSKTASGHLADLGYDPFNVEPTEGLSHGHQLLPGAQERP